MAQQTAVKWLSIELQKVMGTDIFYYSIKEQVEQAKQMEKEQIEKAWWAGHDERDANHMIYPSEDCNQYYNETYERKS